MALADHQVDQPAQMRERPNYGWTLFVGGVIGLTLVKEILGRISRNAVTIAGRSVSRDEAAFSIAVLLRMLGSIGARVLGMRAAGT